MSANDVSSLTNMVRDGVQQAKAAVNTARAELDGALKEVHEVASHVTGMAVQVRNSVAELRAELGQHSNGGPPLEGTK